MIKAVFLDRDGTINRKPQEHKYVTCWNDMCFLPDVARAISLLNQSGFRVLVVSNQRCVAKGLVSEATLNAIHQQMCKKLAADGAKIDHVYYCPHEKYPPCSCRKPAPGLLLAAARVYDINLAASWAIGDSDVDVQAGINAGCRTARILNEHATAAIDSDIIGRTLLETVEKVLSCSYTHGLTAQEQLSLP